MSLLYLIYLNINKKRKTEKLLNGNENNSFKLTQYRGGDFRPTTFTTEKAVELLELFKFKYYSTRNSCLPIYLLCYLLWRH